MRAAPPKVTGGEDEGRPDIDVGGSLRKSEVGRHHAQHGVARLVERYRASDDCRVAREPPLPEAMAEHQHWLSASLLVFGESAAEDRLHPEGAEEVARDGEGDHLFRVIDTAEREVGVSKGGELIKGRAACAPVLVLGGATGSRIFPIRVFRSHTTTSRSGSRYGRGLSRIVCTRLNIAVIEPMPSARVRIATPAKPGLRRKVRNPYRTSWASVSIVALDAMLQPLRQGPCHGRRAGRSREQRGRCRRCGLRTQRLAARLWDDGWPEADTERHGDCEPGDLAAELPLMQEDTLTARESVHLATGKIPLRGSRLNG
jgi:hypothetical protein